MGSSPERASDSAAPPARGRPIFDLRQRWAAGRALLALAAAFTLLALARPLSAPAVRAWLQLLLVLGLGMGVAASALLSSLKGQGLQARLALYAFLTLALDAIGQLAASSGWPAWPLLVLLLGGLAVAEPLAVGLGVAGLASALAIAAAAFTDFRDWQPALAASVGYVGLVLALHQALLAEKRRLAATLDELTSLQTGIDLMAPDGTQRLAPATRALREVSAEGRRARQVERAHERDEFLRGLVALVRRAARAHTALFFDHDRERGLLVLRAWDGPEGVSSNASVPASGDPFGFVLERGQPFYATDYRKLLWALPWHGSEVRVGTLLAVPQRFAGVVTGVLAIEALETQAFTSGEEQLLTDFARLAGEMGQRLRSLGDREELGLESSAIYAALQQLKTLESLDSPETVHRFLLRSAENLLPVEAAAVVRTDGVGYTIEAASGWAAEYEGRGEAVDQATWAAWVTRSSEGGTRVGDLTERGKRMPVLVLHEGGARSEALLAFPLRVALRDAPHHLGAFLVMGRAADLTVQAQRVLEVLAQQAAAVLRIHELTDGERRRALEDGLTGLLNRRAFDQELTRALANADRRVNGCLALLLLDLDHFKRLNDTYGHPAGDAALRGTAQTLARLLRKGDAAARYGGEEFVVILPDADARGARQLAERIRKAIEAQQVVFEGAHLAVTASLGLALWPEDGREQEALLGAADRALYAAKQEGRNRVVAAATLPAPAAGPAP